MSRQPDQIRDDALNVLRDVLRWSMTPDRWTGIRAILDRLDPGLDLADPVQLAALDKACIALELAAQERLTPISEVTHAPDHVRERVNVLIHELAPSAQHNADEAAKATP
jgi:hypothetical protein